MPVDVFASEGIRWTAEFVVKDLLELLWRRECE